MLVSGKPVSDPFIESFPCFDHDSYFKTPYTIWDFTPATYSCPHEMERVGRMGDGGKWVCGMSQYVNFPKNRECVIYSFGVRDESSFGECPLPNGLHLAAVTNQGPQL